MPRDRSRARIVRYGIDVTVETHLANGKGCDKRRGSALRPFFFSVERRRGTDFLQVPNPFFFSPISAVSCALPLRSSMQQFFRRHELHLRRHTHTEAELPAHAVLDLAFRTTTFSGARANFLCERFQVKCALQKEVRSCAGRRRFRSKAGHSFVCCGTARVANAPPPAVQRVDFLQSLQRGA